VSVRATGAVAAAGILVSGLVAHGAEDAGDKARALFEEGVRHMETGAHEAACTALRQSFELSGAKGPLLWLAKCEAARGRSATALALWRRVRDETETGTPARTEAERAVVELERSVPRIVVSAPAGTTLRLDGRAIAPGEETPVDPGRHELMAELPGGGRERTDVVLAAGARRVIEIGARPPPGGGDVASDAGEGFRVAGFVAGGVGIAGLAVFAVTGALVLAAESDLDEACPDRSACRSPEADDIAARGRTLNVVNAIGLGVGAAGVGLGLTLLIVGYGSDGQEARLAPEIAPHRIGLRVQGAL
jgi:hypothetical protein